MSGADLCPEKSQLVEYMLGKLPLGQLESCESHIAICALCEDTIRGLNVSDTLGDLTRRAMSQSRDSTESQLVQQLVQDVQKLASSATHDFDELTIERAAEVSRLLALTDDPQDIGRIAHYRIKALLGAGSTGVVYSAYDEQLGRTVAVKILRPALGSAARERFIAEARAAAAIDHPAVITIYQVGQEGPLAFIAMQLLPGETLESRLRRDVFLREKDVRWMAAQISDGLAAAHKKNLIHRDIKPANVWLDSELRQAKLLDFGLARIVDNDPGFTSTGMIAGTPSYMSPEQSRGVELDPRSDLFSLGCVMYRAATGRQPFGSANVLSTLQAIQYDSPPAPSESNAEVSRELSDLTMCLLEKLPANRPPDSESVAHALRSDSSEWGFPVAHYVNQPQPEKIRTPKSSTGNWIGRIAALVMLGLMGYGGYLFGADIIRIATNHGQLIIETDDPNVKIQLLEQGNLVRVIDTRTEEKIDIRAGKYQLKLPNNKNALEISPAELTMSRGDKQIVRITKIVDGELAVANDDKSPGLEQVVPPPTAQIGIVDNLRLNVLPGQQEKVKRLRELVNRGQASELVLHDAELGKLDTEIEIASLSFDVPTAQFAMQEKNRLLEECIELIEIGLQAPDADVNNLTRRLAMTNTRLNIADAALQQYELNHKLPPSQPVYDGRTVRSWLEEVRVERNMEKLEVAIDAIRQLSDEIDYARLKELVVNMARKYGHFRHFHLDARRRNLYVAIDELSRELTPDDRAAMVCDEIELGNDSSRDFLHAILMQSYEDTRLRAALQSSGAEICDCLLKQQSTGQWVEVFLTNFILTTGFRPEEPAISRYLQQRLKVSESPDAALTLAEAVSYLDSDAEGLANVVEKTLDVYHTNESEPTTLDIMERFPANSENAKQAVPILIGLIEQQIADGDRAIQILAGYDDDVLDFLIKWLPNYRPFFSGGGRINIRNEITSGMIRWRKKNGRPLGFLKEYETSSDAQPPARPFRSNDPGGGSGGSAAKKEKTSSAPPESETNTAKIYNGKSLEQWLDVLKTELSPEALARATNAAAALSDRSSIDQILDIATRHIVRVHGGDVPARLLIYGPSQNSPRRPIIGVKNQSAIDLYESLQRLFQKGSDEKIAQLILQETQEGTLRSRTFLDNVKFPRDAVKRREKELVSALLAKCSDEADAKTRFWAQIRLANLNYQLQLDLSKYPGFIEAITKGFSEQIDGDEGTLDRRELTKSIQLGYFLADCDPTVPGLAGRLVTLIQYDPTQAFDALNLLPGESLGGIADSLVMLLEKPLDSDAIVSSSSDDKPKNSCVQLEAMKVLFRMGKNGQSALPALRRYESDLRSNKRKRSLSNTTQNMPSNLELANYARETIEKIEQELAETKK